MDNLEHQQDASLRSFIVIDGDHVVGFEPTLRREASL